MRGSLVRKGMQVSWLFLVLLSIAGSVQAQEQQCAEEFRRADTVYLEGRFDETIRLLQSCLERATLFVDEAIPVYRLMAMAHLNQGETPEAEAAIASLLVLAPDYEADPIQDPPSYVSLVTAQREDMAQQAALAEAEEETPPAQEKTLVEEDELVEGAAPLPDPVLAVDQEEEQESQPVPPMRESRSFIERPKSLLIAGSGALIIFAALGLAVGGPDTGNQ